MYIRNAIATLKLILISHVLISELKILENYKTINFLKAETAVNNFYVRSYRMDIRRDQRIADIFVEVIRQLPTNLTLLVTLKLKTTGKDPQQRSPTMFQAEFKVCDFLTKKNARLSGFLLPFLRKSIAKSQFPKGCPIQAGNYTWIGLNLEELKIPKFLPSSQYDVTVLTFTPKKMSKDLLCNLHLLTEVK
ncbi:uncharacterized protein LOC133337763 [Musca vetustissima]|uniref:uncharacterized protein LOC133337763 n=1 Tax=Musca vetustissima TaxID=27455 RepID=UPI002AB7F26D|nr:uncharacterized protein LOC133337763 [Musca vetustissima]